MAGLSVTFWGTRGSIPTPGPGTVRYGGNTPCLEVAAGGRRLILDAGTGLRACGLAATRTSDEITILLTHTHWDHIQGLPFFAPLYRPGATISVVGPRQSGTTLEAILHAQMTETVFPVPASAVGATLAVREIDAQPFAVDGFELDVIRNCHPGPTLGYAVRSGGGKPALGYLTDNELRCDDAVRRRADFVRFLHGVELLVHDAMYFESEIGHRAGWGHSTASDAVLLALEAEAERLVLFHHDPGHDDAALERLREEADACRVRHGGTLDVTIAVEGATVPCQGGA
ncbi:MAG: MBL fold metallo-hydrolase [Gemmatimonadales bacterium]